jgi:hypothetical protein
MAYTINRTDGSIFAQVADGTINTDSSVTVIGKNYAGYGEFLGENFIRLLESGANALAPTNPLKGQLWFDAAAGVLKVHNGTTFKNLGSAAASGTAPTSTVVGDMWFDTVNSQLNVYDGSSFILVGPSFTVGTGTSGSIVDTVQDNLAVDHVVVKLYVEDDIVGIISKDAAFTPGTAIAGFTSILPGIQLASTVNGNTPLFQGKATNSSTLDGIAATGFVSATANDTMAGTLGILNDNGLTIGASSDARVEVSGNDVLISNITSNGNLVLKVNNGGTPTSVITIDGTTGRANVAAPTADGNIANKLYVDNSINSGPLNTLALARDGSTSITGIILPDGDNTRDFGSAIKRYKTIYADVFAGRATTAQYADLAERFEADAFLAPGTVVELGGVAEITAALDELSDSVFGVISTNAAYLMNSDAGENGSHPPVAMSGRVPVKVIGKINKGDRLVSAGGGLARAGAADELTPFNVIGRALESKTTEGEGVVEAIVTVK